MLHGESQVFNNRLIADKRKVSADVQVLLRIMLTPDNLGINLEVKSTPSFSRIICLGVKLQLERGMEKHV